MAGAPRGGVGGRGAVPPAVPVAVGLVACAVMVAVAVGLDSDESTAPEAAAPTSAAPALPPATTGPPPDPVPLEVLRTPGPVVDEPTSYRIVYESTENGLSRTETVIVRRPYESSVVRSVGGVQLSADATTTDGRWTFLGEEGGWLRTRSQVHRAADDRPAGSLGALEALGLADVIGESEVAGRRCTLHRAGSLPGEDVRPPTPERSSELCVDDRGLVLSARSIADDAVTFERIASEVVVGDVAPVPPLPAIEPDERLQAFVDAAVPADETTIARLVTNVPVPLGYRLDATVFRATDGRGGGGSEVVRFYSSGPDLLEVAEVRVASAVPLGGGAARPIELPRWREAWFEPGLDVSVVRGRLGDRAYVELRHHDPGFLLAVMESITPAA